MSFFNREEVCGVNKCPFGGKNDIAVVSENGVTDKTSTQNVGDLVFSESPKGSVVSQVP